MKHTFTIIIFVWHVLNIYCYTTHSHFTDTLTTLIQCYNVTLITFPRKGKNNKNLFVIFVCFAY